MAERKWKQKYNQRRNHLLERPQEAATAAGYGRIVGVESGFKQDTPGVPIPALVCSSCVGRLEQVI